MKIQIYNWAGSAALEKALQEAGYSNGQEIETEESPFHIAEDIHNRCHCNIMVVAVGPMFLIGCDYSKFQARG